MSERFFSIINTVRTSLGGGGLLIVCLSVIIFVFSIVFIKALAVRDYSLIKRVWFVPFCGALCLGQSVFTPDGEKIFVTFSVAVSLLLCALLFSIRVRKKVGKEHKQLIDFIDGQIRRSSASIKTPVQPPENFYGQHIDEPFIKGDDESVHLQQAPKSIQKEKGQKELDFTHVKSVISKLSYYGLSPNDKRQVQDLESALYQAEQGECMPGLKSRINDGLGALLKIMSKYGI